MYKRSPNISNKYVTNNIIAHFGNSNNEMRVYELMFSLYWPYFKRHEKKIEWISQKLARLARISYLHANAEKSVIFNAIFKYYWKGIARA